MLQQRLPGGQDYFLVGEVERPGSPTPNPGIQLVQLAPPKQTFPTSTGYYFEVGQAAARNYPTIPFREGDTESLPYGSGSFDYVVCAFGIMHLQQPEAAVAEAHRILRPNGMYAFTQWALNDDLLRIVSVAIAEHGRSDLDVPQAPPPMRFSDPDECRRVLGIYGFREIRIEQIILQWRTDRAEALLELIYSSAVRAALLLEAQEPERRACIHKAIIDTVTAQSDGRDLLIRRPAVLASGIKPL